MLPYYYSLNEYLKDTYGHTLYKVSLNAGLTCPNRDGTLDSRGCIFCSKGGSGDFTFVEESITNQIDKARTLISNKYHGDGLIAYFQAFTNTYGKIEYLEQIFMEAINHPHVQILSIATRPDCLGDDVLSLLSRLNSIKPVWIELGLQTIHPQTIAYIRRGYDNEVFSDATKMLLERKCCSHIVAHMIIGLPNETIDDMTKTARYISSCGVTGIKLQLLHVLKDTDLAKDYLKGNFKTLSLDEYTKCIEAVLKVLPKNMVIHRITGDGPKELLISPMWSTNKRMVLNHLHHSFKEDFIHQGDFFKDGD